MLDHRSGEYHLRRYQKCFNRFDIHAHLFNVDVTPCILCICSADKVASLTWSLSLFLANLACLSFGVSAALLSLYNSLLLCNLSSLLISLNHSLISELWSKLFILYDTNDPTNQIWSISKLNLLLFVKWMTVPTKYGGSVNLIHYSLWHKWLYQQNMKHQ